MKIDITSFYKVLTDRLFRYDCSNAVQIQEPPLYLDILFQWMGFHSLGNHYFVGRSEDDCYALEQNPEASLLVSDIALSSYQLNEKVSILKALRLARYIGCEEEVLPFLEFSKWHGLENCQKQKLMTAQLHCLIPALRERISNVSDIEEVQIEHEGYSLAGLKCTVPFMMSYYRVQLSFPKKLKNTSNPFLLDEEGKPLSFHLRLINNHLRDMQQPRSFNHYEIISEKPLNDHFTFGFLPAGSNDPMSCNHALEKLDHLSDWNDPHLKLTTNRSGLQFASAPTGRPILQLGPWRTGSSTDLLELPLEYRIAKDGPIRIGKLKCNDLAGEFQMKQSLKIPNQQLCNQHIKRLMGVRAQINHRLQWCGSGDSRTYVYSIDYKNKTSNYMVSIFAASKGLCFPETACPFEKAGKEYVLTTGFYIDLEGHDENCYFHFPVPLILEKTIVDRQEGYFIPIFRDAQQLNLSEISPSLNEYYRNFLFDEYDICREVHRAFVFYFAKAEKPDPFSILETLKLNYLPEG